ncbi:sn-glycerol-3-phosphate ABC transporter ATP-binding protein UgpC [Rhodobacter sphaeroides]|uniref:Maltose ABC transporter ATP-binding proteintrehalose ABC transporter ATP-binding proteinsucrose ABC transporter ATP-binding protein n=1 Tax=Cereibacter sphaeroides (strain ATCC 17023 / DSM 158 / JCM 6121 / CCUG 31486 / LMG 2827 / NBRC 12203 / NCIMB 8253 / ATH 2.4.1.) TaxID=272943 RepID=Q3IVB7_CERS4|nr:sn-glycerol-3-phosphate ABC transporter ATP-binding protein UgpC [Cereibacter sphaeroides]ABA81517.1 maltose ABC transporter ATP-binding protein;trehalose ABC transporter ATP-binding protein;sucrose ABC transporter ATP-binding protein [Cereibacter sphaeroides 2.4.1]AMJ50070.1 ABC transporter ATP-binding protein [Cereibacter sphaeroides]ANS36847.1 ABC transporter ATP-binding protein [Cereibacter sphaeroides]ATN65760.1 ABC transporter ATP-binding protein [Cereibacter sphaeroides]AXC63872.1 sn
MAELTLRQVRKTYGSMEVLHGIDLDIPSGSFVVFVGPSGCGKSTLLRAIAGLEDISSGEFAIDGERMNEVAPSRRGIAMVFQSYALYPHMTVFENMAFGMRIAGLKKDEIARRVTRAAEVLQLAPYLDRYPRALSGGQRQRVAIGRAIVRDPKVFLFDEPLSNLDAALRVATRIEIAKLKQAMPGATMIYVTHDQVEAMTLADRIVVLRAGRIEQVGSPLDLYRRPANLFVARFIGSPAMNVIPGTVRIGPEGARLDLATGGGLRAPFPLDAGLAGRTVQVGIRPEDLRLAEGAPLLEGRISYIEQLGEVQLTYIEARGLAEPLIAKLPGVLDLQAGAPIALTADVQSLHLFGEDERSLRPEAALPEVTSARS